MRSVRLCQLTSSVFLLKGFCMRKYMLLGLGRGCWWLHALKGCNPFLFQGSQSRNAFIFRFSVKKCSSMSEWYGRYFDCKAKCNEKKFTGSIQFGWWLDVWQMLSKNLLLFWKLWRDRDATYMSSDDVKSCLPIRNEAYCFLRCC